MNEAPPVDHFEKWYESHIPDPLQSQKELMRAAWNESLTLAADYVFNADGTDFGIEAIFQSPPRLWR